MGYKKYSDEFKRDVLTVPSRQGRLRVERCSSTSRSGTTVSGGTPYWAISAMPSSSSWPPPDILTVHRIGVRSE
jgi:hypothetical protein